MDSPFPFQSLLLFGFLSIMLLIGVVARAKIRFFQRFLFPSCLIGGILGVILVNSRAIDLSTSHLETFAYHFFNISFISVGLTRGSGERKQGLTNGREFLKGPAWMALVQGVTFPLQATLGGLLVLILGAFGLELFPTFGLLIPLGFNEGPGQALSMGKVWEGIGFGHATTIGLSFAAIGFLFSFFVGVPLVNWGIRKGYSTLGPKELPQDFLTGIVPENQKKESAGELTLHSGSTETLAFQAAMLGLIYILTYAFVKSLGKAFSPDIASILWGFFFFFGLCVALIVRWLMRQVGVEHLVDPGVQRRITGWSVDFLIVSTVAAIQIPVVWAYIVPILITALTAGILTTLVVVYLGRRLWSYNLERMVAIYGTVTGTVSCGLLLLRIADPDLKTPVAVEIGIMNVFALPIIGGCMVLINAPVWWDWSIGLTAMVFAGIMVIALALVKLLRLWGTAKF